MVRIAFFAALLAVALTHGAIAQERTSPGLEGTVFLAEEDRKNWLQAWTGYYRSSEYDGAYAGALIALQEEGLAAQGLVTRLEFSIGEYDPDITTHNGAWLLGYRFHTKPLFITGYAGVAYDSHEKSPATNPRLRGTDVGVKLMAEVSTEELNGFYYYVSGSHSTANDTTNVFGRIIRVLAFGFSAGPEAGYFKNLTYEEYKVGGFLQHYSEAGTISIAAGFTDALSAGDSNGYYVNVNYGFSR